MQSIFKLIFCLTLFASFNIAHADEYVCKVTYAPTNNSLGFYGYIFMFKYSAPDCEGMFTGSNVFCTKGATYGPCATANYQYTERGILALQQALLTAAHNNTRIVVSGAWCMNGGNGCGAYMNYYDE